MTKVGIYARVSTTNKGQDLETQLLPLKRYCQERQREIVETYSDTMSWTKEQRPALNQLLEEAKRWKFEAVLVFRFDRISRSTKQLIELLEGFRKLNIHFISITESVDTTTPTGIMIFTIIAAFAKFERDVISERVKFGIEKARESWKQIGRPRKKVDENYLVELRKQGLTYRKIAEKSWISLAFVHKICVKSLD